MQAATPFFCAALRTRLTFRTCMRPCMVAPAQPLIHFNSQVCRCFCACSELQLCVVLGVLSVKITDRMLGNCLQPLVVGCKHPQPQQAASAWINVPNKEQAHNVHAATLHTQVTYVTHIVLSTCCPSALQSRRGSAASSSAAPLQVGVRAVLGCSWLSPHDAPETTPKA